MYNEQPHQELVKCVVVGDTAVGKTRLICARACDTRLTLSQLMTTHIPTVWAIDQYRIYKEVLERSWEVVDGVSVSLRLWDTFGDHDKDRRFAYGRSDVVLLCFSIANPVSLRNCKLMWYPEIRRFCPNTPIILVGCKNDLRYMYRDEQFLSLCRDRSPFFRPLRESDILSPEQGRLLAKEIGAPYYETSVLTHFGVNEVFENVIRAALLSRKQQKFWVTNLKHVQHPLLQIPFCPPKPPPPEITVPASQFEEHLQALFQSQAYTDVIFVTGRVGFSAHRMLLSAVCTVFYKLFTSIDSAGDSSSLGGRSASDSSVVSTLEASLGSFNADTEQLIADNNMSTRASFRLPHRGGSGTQNGSGPMWHRASCQIYPEGSVQTSNLAVGPRVGLQQNLNHPAFTAINVEQCEGLDHRGRPATTVQAIVIVSRAITPPAMQECMRFLYTGKIDTHTCPLTEIQEAAELIDIPDLLVYLSNIQRHEEFLNTDLQKKYQSRLQSKLREACLDKSMFSDVLFQLEDGSCSAHRPFLMARCDMMAAMFRGDFRESSAKVVHFPGVTRECFGQLLSYLYTDSVCDSVNLSNCLELIALANRMCLPRLICLIEHKVVSELLHLSAKSIDVTEDVLKLLEPCQMHNADQLADWCLYHIAVSYNEICSKNLKLLRNLHPENQAYLNRNRWPPVWYLKERDFYERCLRERFWMEKLPKAPKRRRSSGSAGGCLCFASRSQLDDTVNVYRTV